MDVMSRLRRGFASSTSFFVDSWAELKKVKWPNRKELISYTNVVVLTVIFITLYFAVLDLGISKLVRLVSKP